MKKLLTILIATAMILALATTTFAADYKAGYATETPKIDGEIDAIWANADPIEVLYSGDEWDPKTCASGYAKILWTETHVYMLAVVKDDTLPEFDDGARNGIDLWMSELDTMTDNYDSDAGDWIYCLSSTGSEAHYTGNDNIYNISLKAIKLTNDGYVMEIMLPWMSKVQMSEGHVIGFTFAINDDADLDGERDTYCFSAINPNNYEFWVQTEALGHVELVKTVAVIEEPAEGPAEEPVDEPTNEPADEPVADEPIVAPENPSTTDVSAVYAILAAVSALGIFASKKR